MTKIKSLKTKNKRFLKFDKRNIDHILFYLKLYCTTVALYKCQFFT